MTKADLHVKMDPGVTDMIRRYARDNGLNFTAALTSLAVRGLRAEGITISASADTTDRIGARQAEQRGETT